MLRRALLSVSVLAVLSVLAAACSGDGGGGGSNDLTGGTYQFTISSVTEDSCWPKDNLTPPLAVAAIDLLVGSSDGSFTAVPQAAAGAYFQPIIGIHDGNDLTELSGNGTLVATSNCSVSITNTGSGDVTGDDEFELTLLASLDASNDGGAGCAPLSGGDWPGTPVDFPALTNATDGTCSVTFSGTAVPPGE